MGDWIALSGGGLLAPARQGPLEFGLFVAELSLPLDPATVLMQWQSKGEPARTFSIFHEETLGIVIVHRLGDQVLRHVMSGPIPEGSGTARLTFAFDCGRQSWRMELEKIGDTRASHLFSAGRRCHPFPVEGLMELAKGTSAGLCSEAVLWYGLAEGASIPNTGPWIGLRTPFPTQRGTVMAAHLRAGDQIQGTGGDWARVESLRIDSIPSCGSFAPVVLRSPYFGLTQDILVSADSSIAFSNIETEYLFDSDVVLVEARHLADGRTAVADHRRPVTQVARIELDHGLIVNVAGVPMQMGEPEDRMQAPLLHRYEAQTLVALLHQQGLRRTL